MRSKRIKKEEGIKMKIKQQDLIDLCADFREIQDQNNVEQVYGSTLLTDIINLQKMVDDYKITLNKLQTENAVLLAENIDLNMRISISEEKIDELEAKLKQRNKTTNVK